MCRKVNCAATDKPTHAATPDEHTHPRSLLIGTNSVDVTYPQRKQRTKIADHTKNVTNLTQKTDEPKQLSQAVLSEKPFPWAAELSSTDL